VGARCNFVFKQSEDYAVALYSQWGGTYSITRIHVVLMR